MHYKFLGFEDIQKTHMNSLNPFTFKFDDIDPKGRFVNLFGDVSPLCGAAAVCGGGSLPICRWGGSRTCFVLCFQLAAACPPFFICRNENNFLCRGCFHPFLNWVSVRRGMRARGGVGGHPMRDINYSDPRNISVYVDYFQDLLP